MMKRIAVCAMFFCYVHLQAMEQKDHAQHIEKYLEQVLQENNILAHAVAQSDERNSFKRWTRLMRNVGKLETAIECNLIKDKEAEKNIAKGINEINTALQFHLETEKKKGILKASLLVLSELAKNEQEKN